MDDRLVDLLKHFELRAETFQAGPLCHSAAFDASDGMGYIHVHFGGELKVENAGEAPRIITEPSLIFYLNPTTHRMSPVNERVDLVCATIDFGSGFNNPIARALPDMVLIELRDMPTLEMSLRLLFREAEEHHCGRQALLDRLVEIVLIQVLRDLMDRNRLQTGLLAGLAEPRLAKAINAMHAEPGHAWPLEDLAAEAGMSRARFAATFKSIVGMTPGTYLSEWRLGVAQSLLRKGKPVQLVADAVGYGSASALSRAFRSQTGQSPRAWLKQYQANL